MLVAEHVTGLIGETPLVKINGFPLPGGVEIYAKLEFMNPGGSVKDRIGLAMIREAERHGALMPGGTIIEPTAGNTGIGIALAAAGSGYQVIFVVPEKFSREKQELMRALGAEVLNTPTKEGIAGAIRVAEELSSVIPNSVILQQFANAANPEAHYRTTGPEIFEQMNGKVDVLVAGVGTGGTFTGCARYLKEKNERLKAVAVEPEGSILGGGPAGSHRTEGIGLEFIPETLDVSLVDKVATVADEAAFSMVKELAHREGLLAGSSSGAAFYAAWEEGRISSAGTRIAVIFPDSSERYLSTGIYSDRTDARSLIPVQDEAGSIESRFGKSPSGRRSAG